MRLKRTQRKIRRIFSNIESMRHDRLNQPFAVFVSLMPYMTSDTVKSLVILPPPRVFHRKNVPQDLQLVTFGTLIGLQTCVSKDYLKTCCSLVEKLTGIGADRVASSAAKDVLGIVNMIQAEMERIGKLFSGLKSEKTSEELSAGIDRLNFGTFGIVDWYAKRMGIIDHEEVMNTPWARIYQCMKIDFENNEFEKRYRRVIERRYKKK